MIKNGVGKQISADELTSELWRGKADRLTFADVPSKTPTTITFNF